MENLRKLRIDIGKILNEENNVKVIIYISELPNPICLQMGLGKNEIVITIENNGISYEKTKTKK